MQPLTVQNSSVDFTMSMKEIKEKKIELKVGKMGSLEELVSEKMDNETKNPSLESLQYEAKSVDWNDSTGEDEVNGVKQLNELMTSVNIKDIGEVECDEKSSSEDESDSSDEDENRNPLELALDLIRKPQRIEVDKRVLNKLMPKTYTGKVTQFKRMKLFTGRSNYTMKIDNAGSLHLLEGIQLDTPSTVYCMNEVVPSVIFAYATDAGI